MFLEHGTRRTGLNRLQSIPLGMNWDRDKVDAMSLLASGYLFLLTSSAPNG